MKHYRDFEVYRRAYQAALRLHKLTEGFPRSEQFGLAGQLRRSSKSITVNFAEGFSRNLFSKLEFKGFLVMAVGGCDETKVWLGKMLYALWKGSK